MNEQQKKEILPNCDKCDHSYMGYFESSSNYSLKCSMYDSECSYQCKRGCNSFSDKAAEIIDLKKKLEAEKAKVEKLKKCVGFYASKINWDHKQIIEDIDETYRSETYCHGGKLARQTLKEIEG